MKTGWEMRSLGEVVTLNYGKALAAAERDPNGSVPVYGANGVMDWSERSLTEGPSLIVGRKGSAGEVTRVDGPFWPSDVTYYTTHDQTALDFGFLHYTLLALQLPSMARGVKPGINRNDVYALPIPLPSLEEQRRIVAVLDEVFEGLARARAHAEANLKNARELFASELASICEVNAKQYGTISLAELSEEITDGDHMPPPKAQEGVPFVTIKNIDKETHVIDFSDTFKVPETYFQGLKDKRKPTTGDLLYTVTGSFGIPVLVQPDQRFCFQRHIGLIRPKRNISPNWLYFILMSPFVFDQADAGATGTAQRTVSLKLLRSMKVPSVPSELQGEIAVHFRAFRKETDQLASIYRAKVQDLDDLRQSLLQKAFNGELS